MNKQKGKQQQPGVAAIDGSSTVEESLPIACNLEVLPADERAMHVSENIRLFQAVEAIEETTSGYAFRLPAHADFIMQAARFMSLERLCCPFFRFHLILEPAHGAVWLQLEGQEGVKPFVAQAILPQLSSEVAGRG